MENPQVASEPGLWSDGIGGQLLLILILTAINAFFSAAEMALVSVDQTKLRNQADEGDEKSKKILAILSDQSNFLSTIQVVITLSGFFNSAAAATGISTKLGYLFQRWNVPYANTLAVVIITMLLSFFTIVFGELVPKRVALVKSEKFARFSVGAMRASSVIFKPFVKLLSISTNAVLKLVGISSEDVEAKVTINDIKSLVQVGQNQGVIDSLEGQMIKSVIELESTYAEEIMTARPEVFMIDANDSFEEYIDEMLTLRFSRIPVYEDEVDNIIGVLYLKDYLLESYKKGFENVDVRKIVKPAYFVPERKNINELFTELKNNNRHVALLIDEYGGFAGLVTMEDLIEEIVGDIDDEYDHDEPELNKITDRIYIAKGSLSIKELNYQLGAEIEEDTEDYDTLAGLIIFLLGHIPEDGEKPHLTYDNLILDVLEVKDKRVQEVKITVKDKEE